MTHYAAGCEHCGADLDAHRRRQASGAVTEAPGRRERRRIALPELPELSGLAFTYVAITLFAVIWISVVGLILALLGALHGFYEQHLPTIVVFLVLAATALGLEIARL